MTLKMHSDNEITKRQEIVKSPYIYNTKFKYTNLMLLFLFLVIPISNIIILIINEKSKGLIFKRLAIENLLKVKILSELKLKDNKNISFNKIYLRELLTKTDNSKILIIGNPIEEKTVNFIEEYKEIIENRFFSSMITLIIYQLLKRYFALLLLAFQKIIYEKQILSNH